MHLNTLKCGFEHVRGVNLKICECEGESKATLIFLHGCPGQISNWKYQLEYFCGAYHCIVYDQRGYGESEKPRSVTFEDYIEDLATILDERGISNPVLIGHSFGAAVAQLYARDNEVKGLVLIGSLIRWKRGLMDILIDKLPPLLWKRLLFTMNPLTIRLYRKMFFSPETPDEVFQEFVKDNADYISTLPPHVLRYEKYFSKYDASEWLNKIKTPTLIIVGEDDTITPPEHSIEIHKKIENSRLEIIKNAGHLILYEKPRELNSLIEEYLKSLK